MSLKTKYSFSMEELLDKLRQSDIDLQIVDNQLKLDIPVGVDAGELLEEVKKNKSELIFFLNEVKYRKDFTIIEPCKTKEHYKLSSAQQRLYFLYQFDKASVAYNMPMVVKLSGGVDVNKLQEAFQRLIDRHESFRTSFVIIDGEPAQQIAESVRFELVVKDAAGDEVSKLVDEFIQPFDLSKAPLIRVELVKMSEHEHLMMTDMPHIISDGVSTNIMIEEFMALSNGDDLPLLKLQYKDYAEWQQSQGEGQKLAKEREFWLNKYSELPDTLNLPTDYARPSKQSFKGDAVVFALTAEQTQGMRELVKSQNTTMFMLVLSVLNLLLSRLCDQKDIVVGTPTSGRFHDDLANTIGMFVNTLALRNYPSSGKTFASFLEEIKESTLECFDQQSYQYETLIEELKLERDNSRNPLFDVMYTYSKIEDQAVEVTGLRLEAENGEIPEVAKFDLLFGVKDNVEQTFISLSYATDLFSRETIERYEGYFKAIISAILADVNVKLGDIKIISEEEENKLLREFNLTDREYPDEVTVLNLFERQLVQRPLATAIAFGESRITYQELNEYANQLANKLKEKKVGKGDIVALILDRSPQMIINILAVLKVGGAYLPIDPNYPQKRIEYILEDSKAKLLITQKRVSHGERDMDHWVYDENELARFSKEFDSPAISPNDLAYIIYTSGTTGKPKGTLIEHQSIPRIAWNNGYVNITSGDKILQLSNYAFDGSIFDIFGSLTNGATLIIMEPSVVADIQSVSKVIEEQKVTVSFITTSLFNLLIEEYPACFQGCRKIITGGEEMSVVNAKKALNVLGKDRLINAYGPTESTVFATTFNVNEIAPETKSISIGKPVHGTRIYIVDADQMLSPIGVQGELCIAGRGLARGYLNNAALTEERFVSNPSFTEERIYKTGDLARWLPNGTIEFTGRIDQQVKIRGFRIEIGEIESQLSEYHKLTKCFVMAVRQNNEKVLVAYYTTANGVEASESAIRAFMAERLPNYMIPSYFIWMEQLPLNRNGKIDLKALPGPETLVSQDYVAPANETEERLIEIWSEVLNLDKEVISVNKSFFELGGHSLNAVTLANKAFKAFNIELPLQQIFNGPTIQSIAEYIDTTKWLKEKPGKDSSNKTKVKI